VVLGGSAADDPRPTIWAMLGGEAGGTWGGRMAVSVLSPAYLLSIGIAVAVAGGLCLSARRRPGRWTVWAGRALGVLLVVGMLVWQIDQVVRHTWTLEADLPLNLCDTALLVAAIACWSQRILLVELTYFWGLAGTLQAVITPNLYSHFPHLGFLAYVVEHLGILVAALFLIVGMGIRPRPGAARNVFAITAAFTAAVGSIDAATGSNYMFLRARPSEWSLLSVLGPWPWYIFSAAGLAIVFLIVLDAPFWRGRRLARADPTAGIPRPSQELALRGGR
jgi:hypothetical integral membrane protein (TIGR02206 family)